MADSNRNKISLIERLASKMDEQIKECCECGKTKGKLHKITWNEQEYPGASYWTFTDYYCNDCLKYAPNSQPIRENPNVF